MRDPVRSETRLHAIFRIREFWITDRRIVTSRKGSVSKRAEPISKLRIQRRLLRHFMVESILSYRGGQLTAHL